MQNNLWFPAGNRPRWWADPRPGDAIEVEGGRSREVLGRPDGQVEFRDHYGVRSTVTLESWQGWARRNRATTRHLDLQSGERPS